MNYYEARQRKADKKWDFTVMNDGHVRPMGYCIPWERIEESAKYYEERLGGRASEILDKASPFKDKHHSHGHDTKEEAEACYKDYLLDHKLKFTDASIAPGYTTPPSWPCIECGDPTSKLFSVDSEEKKPICSTHANRDTVAKHFEGPSRIISSY